MRSRAAFKSHPIHPMLIPFPFAFLAGGFGFGVAAALTRSADLATVARHLVPTGIASGLAAAVPGLVDYLGSVPPASSAKRRATTHGLVNSAALALFSAGWLASRRTRRPGVSLALQGLGMAALSVGGWLGGTLVYRNQIGVDHRYANAGKWRELRAGAELSAGDVDRVPAGVTADLELNQMALVHAGSDRMVLARTERGVALFQDRCTHRGGPLSDGTLICGTVQCPWHGSQFDVHTGEVKCGPAEAPIRAYAAGRG
jgi:uncharacterized membrane protein/nitrite reductase/ring-hydroxylating ferredoxin subunit